MDYDGYNGSNAIRIILETTVDFSSEAPSEVYILYWKPDDSTGTWTASILTGSETDGKIYYDMIVSETLETGVWWVRARLVYSDTRVLYTQKVAINIGE